MSPSAVDPQRRRRLHDAPPILRIVPPPQPSPTGLPPGMAEPGGPRPGVHDPGAGGALGHPAGHARPRLHAVPDPSPTDGPAGEAGSLVAEYGLLMVLGATITMLATKWATGGAIWELFASVLSRARALVGA